MNRKFLVGFFMTLILVLTGFLVNPCCAAKKVVAVTEIEYDSWSHNQRQAAADFQEQMVTTLVQSGKFDVAERMQLDKVLRELALSSTGLISGETAIEFGHLTGADYTIIGSVISADIDSGAAIFGGSKAIVKFNFRFVDNRTGIIKVSEIIKGSSTNGLFGGGDPKNNMLIGKAVNDASQKLMKLINKMTPLNGSIVNVKGTDAYIDLGKDNGVKVGEVFIVYNEGEPLTQPGTGKVLGVEENDIGQVKVRDVRDSYAICEILKGQNRMKRGDLVKKGEK